VSSKFKVHLFSELDGSARLCYVESGIYCNFFREPTLTTPQVVQLLTVLPVDRMSTYFLALDLSLSLWNLMWSPSGNATRDLNHHSQDVQDLSIFAAADIHAFLSGMFLSQRLYFLPVTKFFAERPSKTRFLSENATVTAKTAAMVLLVVSKLPVEGNENYLRVGLRLVVFGELVVNNHEPGPDAKKFLCEGYCHATPTTHPCADV
jgi:hypothetical protein